MLLNVIKLDLFTFLLFTQRFTSQSHKTTNTTPSSKRTSHCRLHCSYPSSYYLQTDPPLSILHSWTSLLTITHQCSPSADGQLYKLPVCYSIPLITTTSLKIVPSTFQSHYSILFPTNILIEVLQMSGT
jgi:hypothetical protein